MEAQGLGGEIPHSLMNMKKIRTMFNRISSYHRPYGGNLFQDKTLETCKLTPLQTFQFLKTFLCVTTDSRCKMKIGDWLELQTWNLICLMHLCIRRSPGKYNFIWGLSGRFESLYYPGGGGNEGGLVSKSLAPRGKQGTKCKLRVKSLCNSLADVFNLLYPANSYHMTI